MIPNQPRATAVMPVYNREQYLKETIDSVLTQTFQDFEFIIIDDGSTDKSVEIIESYHDPRIKLFLNEKNQGTSYSRNRAIDLSSGEYIITIDSDDINVPDRFTKQIAYMDSHPEVGVCGSWVKTIGEVSGELWRCAVNPEIIHCRTLFEAVMCHPTTILRRQFLDRYSLRYTLELRRAQDWDLYCRGARHFAIANIPEVLVYYRWRNYPKNLSDEELKSERYYFFYEIDKRNFQALNLQATEDEMLIHRRLGNLELKRDSDFVTKANKWLHKLHSANKVAHVYPQPTFLQVLAGYWLEVCSNASSSPLETWHRFFDSPYLEISSLTAIDRAKILGKRFVKESYFNLKKALKSGKLN
ncbi:glycosyltransferase family 2 protein [Argonema antarcticum]|uniref:glycosyltransferase family 2 protein n=1 Tax=Argonema antarcticum TaxID=2942763 RepID=UPI00201181FB|nr:glycosyltransferase [Argonema antarcticum]MCL1472408.1 glycosyltransferase [Argonema antarcticum A004/B2]